MIFKTCVRKLVDSLHDFNDVFVELKNVVILVGLLVLFFRFGGEMEVESSFSDLNKDAWTS